LAVDVEEAAELLAAKLKNKSFKKAVGARAAEAVERLLGAYQCGACLTEREAAELLNNYYIFEARVRRVLELYDKISRGALRAVVREMLGEDFAAEPLEYDLLLKELDAYRRHLFSIAERVLKCHPDHAGPQQQRGGWTGLHGRRDKPG
jgi:hypothetical protein